jgi:large subunit ribosomal protein L18
MSTKKHILRTQRKKRIRAKISGTKQKPRLVIFKSIDNHYVQLIDDSTGKTLIGIGDSTDKSKEKKMERAQKLGGQLAKKAVEMKITECVFDRNGYKYTGRIKAFAEAARESGLKF